MLSIRPKALLRVAVMIVLSSSVTSWGQPSQQEAAAVGASREVAGVPSGQVVVAYENGELTIKSNGASLMEVLQAVCTHIGAELEAPSMGDDVVVGVLGPGAVKDVLATMLTDSPYDFATAGSADDPSAILRIVILPKSAASADKTDKGSDTNNGSDAPPTQDSVAQNPATAELSPDAESQAPPRPTAADVESQVSQVRELFAQMQGELEQATGATSQDMDHLLKQAEAQAKAAVAADPNTPPPIASAPNHLRGRSRHMH
jgi:hypothetical protein